MLRNDKGIAYAVDVAQAMPLLLAVMQGETAVALLSAIDRGIAEANAGGLTDDDETGESADV